MPHSDERRHVAARRGARPAAASTSGGELRYRRRIARWVPWSKWSSALSIHSSGSGPGVTLDSRVSWRSVKRNGHPHRELAEQRRAPDARGAVPAVAGQERHGVDDHEALDALGLALREQQADGAPVVHDEAHPLEPALVEEALEEAVVLVDRVARGSRACPSARSRAGRARGRRSAPGTAIQSSELVGHAVQVQRGGAPGAPARRCARTRAARRSRRGAR